MKRISAILRLYRSKHSTALISGAVEKLDKYEMSYRYLGELNDQLNDGNEVKMRKDSIIALPFKQIFG